MARFLDRLGRAAARRKWVTIGVWVLLAALIGAWGKAAGGDVGTEMLQLRDAYLRAFSQRCVRYCGRRWRMS
jgi:hypothetical protein